VGRLDFDRLKPSESVESFQHRGDFKASRKTETFMPIVPLAPAAILPDSPQEESLDQLLARTRKLREELCAMTAEIAPALAAPTSETTPPL